jgi:hypothetical protein
MSRATPFAVIRSPGPARDHAVPLDDQIEWAAHAAWIRPGSLPA